MDGATVDVCVARVERVLSKEPVRINGEGAGREAELARLSFFNEHPATDLEIRVWTGAASSLAVTRVEFCPIIALPSRVS